MVIFKKHDQKKKYKFCYKPNKPGIHYKENGNKNLTGKGESESLK